MKALNELLIVIETLKDVRFLFSLIGRKKIGL
jgi:hypothetical protein